MLENHDIEDHLQKLSGVFERTAAACVSLIFQKHADVSSHWKVTDHLSTAKEHLITMGCANPRFKSLILVGISNEALMNLLKDENVDLAYACDVLGEFVNSYCALLDDSTEYAEFFGKQIQAVPMLYTGGVPFVSLNWGIEGSLTVEDHDLYIGYVVQQNDTADSESTNG